MPAPKPSYRNGEETVAEPAGGATVVQNDACGKGRSGCIPQFAESAEIGVADRRGGFHFHTADGAPSDQYQIHLEIVAVAEMVELHWRWTPRRLDANSGLG